MKSLVNCPLVGFAESENEIKAIHARATTTPSAGVEEKAMLRFHVTAKNYTARRTPVAESLNYRSFIVLLGERRLNGKQRMIKKEYEQR